MKNIFGARVFPDSIGASPGMVCLSHFVDSSDVETFKPCQGGVGEAPCLTAVQEDGLNYSLEELSGDTWLDIFS